MKTRLGFVLLLIPLLLGGCGLFGGGPETAKKPTGPQTAQGLYNQGVERMNASDFKQAITDFDQVEVNFPFSPWAVNAQLMHGYAAYLQQDYTGAIGALDRFIQLHPANQDIAYAYYLRALCYYEEISDVARDQKATHEAIAALQEVVSRFPGSAYANDARLKIDLCNDHLAGHEMMVGRFYERQHDYIAAIGRYQGVVKDYQTTNHVAEALERLVECYLKLGMVPEAQHAGAVLGTNYPGSHWYRDAYARLHDAGVVASYAPAAAKGGGPGFFGGIWEAIF
ncbi:MAG: outer membrane protein assembly factor BamD [Acetobacteraceae bacterium]